MKRLYVDFSRYISLQITALKLFRVWFYIKHPIKSLNFWLEVLCKIVLGVMVYIIPTGGQIVYVIRLIMSERVDIQEIAGIINLILTELLASCRLLDLHLRRKLFTQLSKELISEVFQCSQKHRINLVRAMKLFRWMFWILLISGSIDIIVHVLVVPGLHNFQILPLKMDLIFFDVNEKSYFKYVFIYQILYKPMMLLTFVALQTLPWATMWFARSQLDVLIYNIKNMKKLVKATTIEKQCDENEGFKMVFKECVLHHSAIMRFIHTLQATFGGQLTSTLFLNGCIICTTAVQIFSIESPMKNITMVGWILMYLSIFIGMLYIDCYFGNIITVKSAYVSTLVIQCPWLDLPRELKKNVVIFIARTQQPVVIMAANLVPISLDTFTKTMILGISLFLIMNRLNLFQYQPEIPSTHDVV